MICSGPARLEAFVVAKDDPMTKSDAPPSSPQGGRKPEAVGQVRADVIANICQQIEPYLPLKSVDELGKKLKEIRIGSQSIPLSLIARHIGGEVFPLKDAKDLRAKIDDGAARAVSMARSISSLGGRFDQAVGDLVQKEAKIGLRRPAVHRIYYPD